MRAGAAVEAAEVDLIVVGAGPKAAAVAAKAHAMNCLGFGPISVMVVERLEAAASWSGHNGMTSGEEPLAITPMKDVGFPYETHRLLGARGREIDSLLTEFSWPRYLIEEDDYAKWLNAGLPHVQHRLYGRYLAWALSRASEGVEVVKGRVTRVAVDGDDWSVEIADSDGASLCRARARALMLTGTGVHRHLPHDLLAAPRIFHCDDRRSEFARIPEDRPSEVAIVGAGDGALSCGVYLRATRPRASLTFYTPTPPLSRGESFLENRVFSNPDCVGWESLDLQVRRGFMRHTYQGLFGPDELEKIAGDENCAFTVGRVTHVAAEEDQIEVRYDCAQTSASARHDYLVNCTGFDVLGQIRPLFSASLRERIEAQVGPVWDTPEQPELRFGRMLEVEGLRPLLHIPGLAALSQGPGFANLGCLGLLSDRILQSFIREDLDANAPLEQAAA